MKQPTELKKGDRCPNCGGQFVEAPTPTKEQRERAADRENPEQLPPHYDSATESQREQLGALYKCGSCGYKARFPLEGQNSPSAAPAAGQADQTRGQGPRETNTAADRQRWDREERPADPVDARERERQRREAWDREQEERERQGRGPSSAA